MQCDRLMLGVGLSCLSLSGCLTTESMRFMINHMRPAHADCWCIVFEPHKLADDQVQQFHDNPYVLRDDYLDSRPMLRAAQPGHANDSHDLFFFYLCGPHQVLPYSPPHLLAV